MKWIHCLIMFYLCLILSYLVESNAASHFQWFLASLWMMVGIVIFRIDIEKDKKGER